MSRRALLRDKPPGVYEYTAELVNGTGMTLSEALIVKVEK